MSDNYNEITINALQNILHSHLPNIILGTGHRGRLAETFLEEHSIPVAGFCEGEKYFGGRRLVNGKPTYKYGEFPSMIGKCNLIIAASVEGTSHFVTFPISDPVEQIDEIYVFEPPNDEYDDACIFNPRQVALKRAPKKIVFEVDVVSHCNLNCASCSHFSPIADHEFIDIEEFRRDMERLGDLFSHEGHIGILGGEPLLHPQITSLLKIARGAFGQGVINMATNGILLHDMEDAFWQVCYESDINILISAYPIKINIEKIQYLAKKFDVKVLWAFGQKEGDRTTFSGGDINLAGNGNRTLNFSCCIQPGRCVSLRQGRLYICGLANHVRHFNKRFSTNIPITEDDYIDIYQENDKDVILQRLVTPIPLCGYCSVSKPARIIPWHISKGDIDEWIYQ